MDIFSSRDISGAVRRRVISQHLTPHYSPQPDEELVKRVKTIYLGPQSDNKKSSFAKYNVDGFGGSSPSTTQKEGGKEVPHRRSRSSSFSGPSDMLLEQEEEGEEELHHTLPAYWKLQKQHTSPSLGSPPSAANSWCPTLLTSNSFKRRASWCASFADINESLVEEAEEDSQNESFRVKSRTQHDDKELQESSVQMVPSGVSDTEPGHGLLKESSPEENQLSDIEEKSGDNEADLTCRADSVSSSPHQSIESNSKINNDRMLVPTISIDNVYS